MKVSSGLYNVVSSPPEPMTANSSQLSSPAGRVFASLIRSNDPLGLLSASDCDTLGEAIEDTLLPLTSPPLESLPCANLCPGPGKMPCVKCKLVSYCSQVRPKLDRALVFGGLMALSTRNVKGNIGRLINKVCLYPQLQSDADYLQFVVFPFPRLLLTLRTTIWVPRDRFPCRRKLPRWLHNCSSVPHEDRSPVDRL